MKNDVKNEAGVAAWFVFECEIFYFWFWFSARSLQRPTLWFLFYFYAFLMKPFRWPEATDGNCIYDNEKSLRMYICLKIQNHKVDKQLLSCALTLMFYGCFFFSCFFYYRSNLKDIFPFSDNLVRLVNNLMFRISMQIEFTINKSRCQADGKILASLAWQQNYQSQEWWSRMGELPRCRIARMELRAQKQNEAPWSEESQRLLFVGPKTIYNNI